MCRWEGRSKLVTKGRPKSAMLRAPMSGNAGMRPVPSRMMRAISSRDRRVPTSTSGGAAGDPVRSSLWQVAHLLT